MGVAYYVRNSANLGEDLTCDFTKTIQIDSDADHFRKKEIENFVTPLI